MSKIKNDGLDQCGAKPFEQQQFETAGVEGVNGNHLELWLQETTDSPADVMPNPNDLYDEPFTEDHYYRRQEELLNELHCDNDIGNLVARTES